MADEPVDPRFPLGAPINRTVRSDLTPISGRPNWFLDRHGKPVYVEPEKQVTGEIDPAKPLKFGQAEFRPRIR